MKKLLTILGAVGLTATGTTSAVVSCDSSDIPTPPTPTPPQDDKIDLASWKGELVGAQVSSNNLGAKVSNLKATYETVGGLQKGIAFQLGELNDTEDITSDGIKVFAGSEDDGSDAVEVTDGTTALLDTQYYFVTMTAKEGSTKIKNKCEKKLVKAADKKMDLKNITTVVNTEFATTTAATDDTTDSKAAQNATASIGQAISNLSGFKLSLVSASFDTNGADKVIFDKAEVNALIVGSDETVISNKAIEAQSTSTIFTGSIAEKMFKAKATTLDLASAEGTYNITVPLQDSTGQDNWDANDGLTAPGAHMALASLIKQVLSKINPKLSQDIKIGTFPAALYLGADDITLYTKPGEYSITGLSINEDGTGRKGTGSDQLSGTVTPENLKFNLIKGS